MTSRRTNTLPLIGMGQREAEILFNGSEGEYFTPKSSSSLFIVQIK